MVEGVVVVVVADETGGLKGDDDDLRHGEAPFVVVVDDVVYGFRIGLAGFTVVVDVDSSFIK